VLVRTYLPAYNCVLVGQVRGEMVSGRANRVRRCALRGFVSCMHLPDACRTYARVCVHVNKYCGRSVSVRKLMSVRQYVL
jgi:hypothetical protein